MFQSLYRVFNGVKQTIFNIVEKSVMYNQNMKFGIITCQVNDE